MATFTERLKKLRKDKGLTQKDLAQEMNVAQGKISSWENGKLEPNLVMLTQLGHTLESTIDYLLGYSDVNHWGATEHFEEEVGTDTIGQHSQYYDYAEDFEADLSALTSLCKFLETVLNPIDGQKVKDEFAKFKKDPYPELAKELRIKWIDLLTHENNIGTKETKSSKTNLNDL
ncbi:helix-turn-helix domain-containing protein [Lactococcus garvieae]|uniref:helix-turn-helix domain-containing protein n=1 Tax=Lactococcus garvieae TaxID=1363 RepID=UPI0022E2D733|nr:helix-turn-helix transcriptional regulator [Lactococcus garvieae]